MSKIDRVWLVWIMAETLVRDGQGWLQSSERRRQPAQGLVEYAFGVISVVAIAIAFWALLQVAMNAVGQRTVTAVNDVK
jgi:hypothetical protein